MKKSTFILGLLTATLLSSCGVSRYSDNCEFKKTYTAIGVLATEDREVSDFSAIDFKGITRADIRIGNEYSLKIEADKNWIGGELGGGFFIGEMTEEEKINYENI